MRQQLNNFTGGEITPQLDARSDLQKYATSCRRLENFRVKPYGGATYRAGTLYIAAAKEPARKCRLIPFVYSTSIAYVIELGHLYMRFYRDGARIETSPGVAYEIASDFVESELFAVQYKQINDVMYLVHPNHPQRKIARLADANWTTQNVAFDYPALLDENATTTTLTASATLGTGITVTASAAAFQAGHVGAVFELKHLRPANKVELDISVSTGTSTSSTLAVKGDWTLVTTERWYGQLNLQRSTDNGATWETIRTYTAASDRNISASGNQADAALFRLEYIATGDPYGSPPWTGTAPTVYVNARAALEVVEAYVAGLVVVTGFTSSTVVTADVIYPIESTAATDIWSEGAWSTARGYPRTVALFEQRLFFGGTAYKPNTIWGSVTADFENFQYGETDDAAVAYQIAAAQQNPIQWMESLVRLYAVTSGGEHVLSSGNLEEALTPSNVAVRDPSSYGSEAVQGVKIENGVLFMQRQGRRLRELRDFSPTENSNENEATDLTLLAEHITANGVTQLAYARLPDPYLYAVLGDGQMGVMAYNRKQEVNGWSRYITTGDAFESVVAVPGSPSDVVYVAVRRTINGSTVRYIEVFTAETVSPSQFVHTDCSIQTTGPVTTVTGLSHLEGESVSVVAGTSGYLVTNGSSQTFTVSGGQITLPQSELFVRVGLGYQGKIEPMTLDAMLQDGTSQGRRKRIGSLVFRFKETRGGIYGNAYTRNVAAGAQMAEIPFRSTEDNMDEAPPLFSGDVPVQWEGGNDFDDDLQISQIQPFPMTVLAIFPKIDAFGS